jgi:hypothetical protein
VHIYSLHIIEVYIFEYLRQFGFLRWFEGVECLLLRNHASEKTIYFIQ